MLGVNGTWGRAGGTKRVRGRVVLRDTVVFVHFEGCFLITATVAVVVVVFVVVHYEDIFLSLWLSLQFDMLRELFYHKIFVNVME